MIDYSFIASILQAFVLQLPSTLAHGGIQCPLPTPILWISGGWIKISLLIIKLALAHDMTGLIDSFNIILFSLFHSTLKSARVTQKRKFQNFHKAQIWIILCSYFEITRAYIQRDSVFYLYNENVFTCLGCFICCLLSYFRKTTNIWSWDLVEDLLGVGTECVRSADENKRWKSRVRP